MSSTIPTAILLSTLSFFGMGNKPDAPPAPPAQEQPAAEARPAQPQGKQRRGFRAPGREQVAMRMMLRQLLLNRYDANQDGELDEAERRQLMQDAQAARKQQAIEFARQFDTDGDGKLDRNEREAMKKAVEQLRAEHKAAQPADEPEAAEGQHPRPREGARHGWNKRPHARRDGQRRHHGQPRPQMDHEGQMSAMMLRQLTMDAYDADKDGQLDQSESDRLKADGEKMYDDREAALKEQYDADKDGSISREELRAAMQALFPRPEAKEGEPRRNRPHAQHRPRRQRDGLHYLLDTHFDADILFKLAQPQEAGAAAEGTAPATPPCAPSTPSAN